jgi:hypothetical protein
MAGNKFSLADRGFSEPHPSRLSPDQADFVEIMQAHDAAMAEGKRGYSDPTTGAFVFTAKALADEGYCCSSSCRHCPYVD